MRQSRTSSIFSPSCQPITTEKSMKQQITKMGKGWNLSNSMEATGTADRMPETVQDFEVSWGEPITTKAIIQGVQACGFSTIRIPVAWSNLMSKDGRYQIAEAYLLRVKQIVESVLQCGMCAIVNIHWDGGWWKAFGAESLVDRDEAMKKYEAIWSQIAVHFRDVSDSLILESANEELGDSFGTRLHVGERYALCNRINQRFVDLVRASGGENATRYLLIAGYNTDISCTCDARFRMPKDSVAARLMVSVHYYTPSTFCIAETEDNSWGFERKWGTPAELARMRVDFARLRQFQCRGYGVVVGEYGVAKDLTQGHTQKKVGTALYLKIVGELAKEYGYCPILWDPGSWYLREERSIVDPEIAALFREGTTNSE